MNTANVIFKVNRLSSLENTVRVKVEDPWTINVNLDARDKSSSFKDALTLTQAKSTGWTRIRRSRREGRHLYVGSHEVSFSYRCNSQCEDDTVTGHDIRRELQSRNVLHPNIMDALVEHPEFLSNWLMSEIFRLRGTVYFWDGIYVDSGGKNPSVRGFGFSKEGVLRRVARPLSAFFGTESYAAVAERRRK